MADIQPTYLQIFHGRPLLVCRRIIECMQLVGSPVCSFADWLYSCSLILLLIDTAAVSVVI